jgi:hypothetical protein
MNESILCDIEKGIYMNALERFHVYKIIKLSNPMNHLFSDSNLGINLNSLETTVLPKGSYTLHFSLPLIMY